MQVQAWCYKQLLELLKPELEALQRVGFDLRARDREKFSQIRARCDACGKPMDWLRILVGVPVAMDADGDFAIPPLAEAAPPLACACGSRIVIDFLHRRGASARSGERRQIFIHCQAKLRALAGFDPTQVDAVLRLVFRLAIVESIVDLKVGGAVDAKVIELIDVHRVYQVGKKRTEALRGANLTLRGGEFCALVGTSGAGKSTLLNIVGCIDTPTSGRVLVDGADVASLTEAQRADLRNRRIGFVFQSFNLLPVLSVYENVELPLLAQPRVDQVERRRRVLAAIDLVELTAYLQHRPDQLSGGERQRVAVARALVTDPVIVIADEPTANLDSATAHQIINYMAELNELKRVTFLFSTHDEKLVKRMRRIVNVVDGRTVES